MSLNNKIDKYWAISFIDQKALWKWHFLDIFIICDFLVKNWNSSFAKLEKAIFIWKLTNFNQKIDKFKIFNLKFCFDCAIKARFRRVAAGWEPGCSSKVAPGVCIRNWARARAHLLPGCDPPRSRPGTSLGGATCVHSAPWFKKTRLKRFLKKRYENWLKRFFRKLICIFWNIKNPLPL